MGPQKNRLGGGDSCCMYSHQISHFFLGPSLDHFPWVLSSIAFPEPELSTDVLVPVLEDQDAGLEDLDCPALSCVITTSHTMIHISLLASGNASINFCDKSPVQKFEQDHPSSGVHHLLHCRSVRLVPHPGPSLAPLHLILTNIYLSGKLFFCRLKVRQLGAGHLLVGISTSWPSISVINPLFRSLNKIILVLGSITCSTVALSALSLTLVPPLPPSTSYWPTLIFPENFFSAGWKCDSLELETCWFGLVPLVASPIST